MNVRSLREKYEEIVRLRALHARPDEPDPSAALRALASRFPGALREIDTRSMEELHRRIASLTAVIEGAREEDTWMAAQVVFHRELRGALAAKRWLGKRRIVGAYAAAAFVTTFAADADVLAWADDLATLARPPRGRILDVVLSRAALQLGCTLAEVRVRLA